MIKPFEHLSDTDLRLVRTSNQEIIDLHPDDPDSYDRIVEVHGAAQEQRRRLLGDQAVSHIAQQQPGSAPIDTERWRI